MAQSRILPITDPDPPEDVDQGKCGILMKERQIEVLAASPFRT
jgi:hypothetical protein